MHVNLLPSALHQQLVIRRTLRQWLPLLIGVVVALVLYLGLSWWELASEESELAAIEMRQAEWSKMQSEMVDFLRRVSAAEKKHAEWRPAEERTIALPVLVALSRSVEAARGNIQVQQCQVSPAPDSAAAAPPAPGQFKPAASATAAPAGRSVSLGGVSLGDAALMDFVKALQEIGKFKKVEIKSLANSPRGPGLREWRLDCSL
jgi:hypothetical protein